MLSFILHGGIGAASHIPILAKMVMETTGDVLEVGAGLFSTPLLNQLLEGSGRRLITIESEKEWIDFLRPLANEYHTILKSDNNDLTGILDWCSRKTWGLVFIDNHPDHLRHTFLQAVKSSAEFIVCHDTQEGHLFDIGWNETLSEFKYKLEVKHLPWTTVVSNSSPIPIKNRWSEDAVYQVLQLKS